MLFRSFLNDRYLVPRPRNAIASVLRKHATAAMDISDGFIGDLTKMLSLAGLGADIKLGDVPYSVAARAAIRNDPDLQETALTGGDDYEVVAAVSALNVESFMRECLVTGTQVTRVGTVLARGEAIRFLEDDGRERHFAHGSYSHGIES